MEIIGVEAITMKYMPLNYLRPAKVAAKIAEPNLRPKVRV